MTWLAIVNLLGGWRAAIFAVLCVALGATTLLQSMRLNSAQDRAGTLANAVADYRDAQTTNLQTIDDMRETIKAWALKCALNPAAASEAAAATEQANGALPADDQRRESERESAYVVDPSAAAWGRVRVPAGLLGRLRK